MTRTVAELVAAVSVQRQERIHARANEQIAEELTSQLRKAWNKARVAVARKLNIGQDTVLRYERRADPQLSTLHRYVETVHGKQSLLVEFPDRKPVKIAGFGELSVEPRKCE